MNPRPPDDRDPPPPPAPSPRDEFEARLTALILGEAGDFEAETLRARLAADPDLAALYRRLEDAAGVYHKALHPHAAAAEAPTESGLVIFSNSRLDHPVIPGTPAQLSPDRRAAVEKLFTPPAAPTAPIAQPPARKRRAIVILAEVFAVAACLAILGSILIPRTGSVLVTAKNRPATYADFKIAANKSQNPSTRLEPGAIPESLVSGIVDNSSSGLSSAGSAITPPTDKKILSASDFVAANAAPGQAAAPASPSFSNEAQPVRRTIVQSPPPSPTLDQGGVQPSASNESFADAAAAAPAPGGEPQSQSASLASLSAAADAKLRDLMDSSPFPAPSSTGGSSAPAETPADSFATAAPAPAATPAATSTPTLAFAAGSSPGASGGGGFGRGGFGGGGRGGRRGGVDGTSGSFAVGGAAASTSAPGSPPTQTSPSQVVDNLGNLNVNAGLDVRDQTRLSFDSVTSRSVNNSTDLAGQPALASGAIVVAGSGSLTLNSTNTYTGNTVVSNGLRAKSGPGEWGLDANSPSTDGAVVTNGVTLDASGSGTLNFLPTNGSNLVINGGTLQSIGPANRTDRLFTLGTTPTNTAGAPAPQGQSQSSLAPLNQDLAGNPTQNTSQSENRLLAQDVADQSAFITNASTGANPAEMSNSGTPSGHQLAVAGAINNSPDSAAPSGNRSDVVAQTDLDYESQYVFRGKKIVNPGFSPSAQFGYPIAGGNSDSVDRINTSLDQKQIAEIDQANPITVPALAESLDASAPGAVAASGGNLTLRVINSVAAAPALTPAPGAASASGAGSDGIYIAGQYYPPTAQNYRLALSKQAKDQHTFSGGNAAGVTITAGTPNEYMVINGSRVPLTDENLAKLKSPAGYDDDQPLPRPPATVQFPAPVAAADNPFSTFALNVNDASYRLALVALQRHQWPLPADVRTEEFLNAFNYHDPAPADGAACALHSDLAQDPFETGRDLLRVSLQTAATGRNRVTPLHLTILLDNSGSMTRSDRVATLQAAIAALGAQLRPGDFVSLVTFARTPQVRLLDIPAAQFSQVADTIAHLVPDGGTNLEEALKAAYAVAGSHQGGSFGLNAQNRVILLTDGAANLGNVDPAALAKIVDQARVAGIALDAYGVGWDGYDDTVLEALTRHSDGRYAFLNRPEDVNDAFAAKLAGALTPAALDVKVQIEFNPARVTTYRLMGYNNLRLTKEQFRDNSVAAGELAAAEQGTALYSLVLNSSGTGPVGTARARFRDPATGEVHEMSWTLPYNGPPPAFDQAPPALRLAAVAAYFAEYLQQSPFATEVTPAALLSALRGTPEVLAPDPRPAALVEALNNAAALAGR